MTIPELHLYNKCSACEILGVYTSLTDTFVNKTFTNTTIVTIITIIVLPFNSVSFHQSVDLDPATVISLLVCIDTKDEHQNYLLFQNDNW